MPSLVIGVDVGDVCNYALGICEPLLVTEYVNITISLPYHI